MASINNQFLADLTFISDILSDKTRLHIVLLLAQGDCNVTRLIKALKIPQPLVSHHLGLLRMNRTVVARRKSRQVIYSLAENIKVSGGKLKYSLPAATVTIAGI